jgi:cell division protein FtsB
MSETKEVRYPRRWKPLVGREVAVRYWEQESPSSPLMTYFTTGRCDTSLYKIGEQPGVETFDHLPQHTAAAAGESSMPTNDVFEFDAVAQPAAARGEVGEELCCIAGNPSVPASMLRKDVAEVSNTPDDEVSKHLTRLYMLHIWTMSEPQKLAIIAAYEKELGIKTLRHTHAPQAATGVVPFVGKVGPVLKLSCCLSEGDVAQVEKLLSDYAALAAERDGLREEVKKWKNETEFNFRLMKKCSTELEQARAKLDRVENALVRTPGADVGDEAYRICRELGATREALRKILIEVRCLWQQAESRHNSYRKLEELPEGHATGDAYRFALAALSPAAEAKKPDEDKIDELMQRVANTGHLATEPPKEWIADRTFADDERVTPVVERDDESPYWLAGALKPDVSVVPSANYDALKLELAGIREEDERLTQLYANVMIQNEALQAEIVALRQQLTAAEAALAEANERNAALAAECERLKESLEFVLSQLSWRDVYDNKDEWRKHFDVGDGVCDMPTLRKGVGDAG